MKEYHLILALMTSFSVVLLATPALIKVAKLKHLVDEPSEARKLHKSSTPTIGGVIIFSAFMFSCFLWFPNENPGAKDSLGEFMYLMGSLILLFFVGIKDDIIGMSPMKKLLAHIMVGFILVVMGEIRITGFHGLLGMDITWPEYAQILVSIFVYIVIVNAINLVDGVDGLASGVGLIACIAFGIWFSSSPGNIHLALISFAMAGALFGFLIFNFNPARIFMGDSGSLIIGAVLSVLAIKMIESPVNFLPADYQNISTPVAAMAILAYPLLDTLRVFTIRALQGRSPLSADRNHLHHKLMNRHRSHKKTALTIYAFSLIIIAQTYFFQFENPNISFLISLGIAGLFVGFVFIGHKKRDEESE
jgi:UDP-GlcNAc:undecaprenyl-phosphate/decaprenyl-phosphate GlcNAc-1-phosphate transferase